MTESTFYLVLFLGLALVGALVLVGTTLFNDWIDREIDDYTEEYKGKPKRTTTIYMNRPELDFDLKELDKKNPKVLGTDIRHPKFGD